MAVTARRLVLPCSVRGLRTLLPVYLPYPETKLTPNEGASHQRIAD
jgi:hypothetical protein